PLACEGDRCVAGEPRSARRVVHSLGRTLSDALDPVPGGGQIADLVVAQPFEAVQPGAWPLVNGADRQPPCAGVATIEQHETRPILARVALLDTAVHLARLARCVNLLADQHGLAVVHQWQELSNISEEQEVAIAEQ